MVDDSQAMMMILKGKRTKRQRPHSPLALSLVSYSSGGDSGDDRVAMSPGGEPLGGIEEGSGENDEEDMAANCLILLAQGRIQQDRSPGIPAAAAAAGSGAKPPAPAAGFCVYQCRTCDRCFPSFQALGGHRASHKRPRAIPNSEDKKGAAVAESGVGEEKEEGDRLLLRIGNRPSSSSTATASNSNICRSSRVHECAICGSEFASGQALGGHMRRHRVLMAGRGGGGGEATNKEEPRGVLSLDLNLPAPEESKFLKERTLVFSASSLVDCHY